MKQSTKLLSLVLALVMAFSCMSVIGNAALVKGEVKWDNIDDARLTAEQVADLALDLVDNDLLAGIEPIDLSILGELRLNKIDYILQDVDNLRGGLVWGMGSGLLGDIGKLDFNPLLKEGKYGGLGSRTVYQRSHGDLNIAMALLGLIGNDNNSDIISKIAYGLGTNDGISLGLVGSFLDLGEIGDLLGDIPKLLKTLVYDLIIYGSYGFDKDAEELGNTLPSTVDTLDEMVAQAIGGLLVNPQDFHYEGDTKVWHMDALLMPTLAAKGMTEVQNMTKITENSVFSLIDKIAPYAIYDLGVGALNNNLKKTLLEAVEVEFVEIDKATLPAEVAEDFEVDAVDGEESYVTYIAYDRIYQDGKDFYYTTLETEPVMEGGKPVLDEDGNETTEKVRKFFKANAATANDFYDLIDFGWNFVAPKPGAEEDSADFDLENLSALNYKALIAEYGSIMESLNHLLYVVFETAVKQDVKDYFADMTGDYWVDGATTETYADGTSIFMDNASRLLKYLLAEHADRIFGSDSPYVAWEYSEEHAESQGREVNKNTVFIEDLSILDIIAIIGPVLFEDVMPQLIMPKNADGTYAFHEGVQVLEFGAIILREFITEIAPQVNYDAYIFAEGTVTSANDRQFKVQNAETWFNIILNMGVDVGYTYLNNITNFNTATPAVGITEARWKDMLGKAVDWAAGYVSDGTNSVIHGLEPAKVKAYTDPLDKLSYVLNTILPLGFICGCTTDKFDFDISVVFDKLKSLLTTFDLTEIASLFGRNTEAYNILGTKNLVDMVLNLVNGIVNLVLPISENGDDVTGLLQGVGKNSLDEIVTKANLKITVQQLLRALYTQGRELLTCALPVVAMFIKGWGTEQQFQEPEISLERSIDLVNGATESAQTVTVRNASDGVWRHYRDAAGKEYTDEQYQIKLMSVNVYDEFAEDGSSAYVSVSASQQTIGYGAAGSFTYTAANVPTSGKLVRFKVGYKVIDEDGQEMANGKTFYTESYAYLNYNGTDAGKETFWNNKDSLSYAAIYSPHYVPLSSAADYIAEIVTGKFGRDYKFLTSDQKAAITASTQTIDGITFGNVSMKFANSNKGRYFNDLKQFKTYTVQATNEDGEVQSGSGNALTVNGSVNEAAWKATNKTSGSTSNWSITLKAKDKDNGPHTFTLRYYDDIAYNKLNSLAISEMNALRLGSAYNGTGKVYAGSLLESANTTDENGEVVLRETAFTDTAWVANADAGKWAGSYTGKDGTVYTETVKTYAASAVTITDEEGENGYVMDGEEKINVKKVTVIDCATAINSYVPAFLNGVRGGVQAWNANSVWNLEALYEALEVASNDVGYCKKSAIQTVREGAGENIDATVDALKADLAASEALYSDAKDYTDYKMYRWNRYNDARDDAAYYINLKNDASNATVAEIDQTFPYTGINEDDLRALVAGDKYEDYIVALLEDMDEEELKSTAEWLKNRKEEYQTTTLLDVQMANSYLNRMGPRLLARDHGVVTTYLADEVTSAENMIGTTNGAKGVTYTQRSWDKYIAAYNDAKAVLAKPTQMTVFDAKWELLCCRNELVVVGNEADYSELEALIAQATQALANADLYDNTDKELGQVLAELGYHDFTNADGDDIQLFPGSALYVNKEPYGVDEQGAIDAAANELKEALARLKFKALNITGADVATEVIVPGDEEAGIADITASVARIAPELNAGAVKALLGATADGANVTTDLITVANDVNYTIDTEVKGFVGTNSVVTFYTLVGGVKVPVATIKIVVEADVNGDGVADVIDAAYATLVSQEKAELEGCYFLAANLDEASEEIVAADISEVVNKVLGIQTNA